MSHDDAAQKIIDAGEAGLWFQMEQMLSARRSSNPDDRVVVARLADLYRKRGDLKQAAAAYSDLARLCPEDRSAEMLAAVCQGDDAPAAIPQDEIFPAPFVVRHNFLPPKIRQQLVRLLLKNEGNLQELDVNYTGTNQGSQAKRDRSIRHQFGVYCEDDLAQIIRPRVDEQLPSFLQAMQMDRFDVRNHTMRLDSTPDGGFGRMHQDVGFGAKLIYLYYFHTHPKKFSGGDLLIFDQHVSENTPVPDSFTSIRHTDNTLVAFAPHYFHQVTRVHAKVPDLAAVDSRLSVCGFVHPVG